MSSDSEEDDCYGNVAQQLQNMKNDYQEDKIETTNLLEDTTESTTEDPINDSAELDEIVKKCAGKGKRKQTAAPLPAPAEAAEENSNSSVNDLPGVSNTSVSAKTPGKRLTRSAAKRGSNIDPSELTLASVTRTKRKKTTARSTATTNLNVSDAGSSTGSISSDLGSPASLNVNGAGSSAGSNVSGAALNVVDESSRTGRGRGRGRKSTGSRSKGRRRGWWRGRNMFDVMNLFSALMPLNCDASVPTYSVGNTDDYFDQSEQQALFTNQSKQADDVVVLEDSPVDPLDDNEELSVKVYWQSSEFFKFSIRKYQKLSSIFEYFSKKENVSQDKVLLTFNDKILKPDDTPDSIGYSIVKFIDGGVVNQSVVLHDNKDTEATNGIKLKFQCGRAKKPLELTVRRDQRLAVAMLQCAEHWAVALEGLRFEFDGDLVPGKATPEDLELEGGECIDVKILS